jgi:hypothetical protein
MFLQRAIYGEQDIPNACYANTSEDGNTSRPFVQTSIVAPGEIDDRYRNADPGKGIGYPMFMLERLYDAAEVMHNAGFDPYGYRGSHKQSIEMASLARARPTTLRPPPDPRRLPSLLENDSQGAMGYSSLACEANRSLANDEREQDLSMVWRLGGQGTTEKFLKAFGFLTNEVHLAAWTSRIILRPWPNAANLETTARPTWAVASVTRIIMPLHVPA